MPSPVLTTTRLQLRWLTLEDAPLMLAVWNDPAFVQYVADRGIRTVEEAASALGDGALRQYEAFGYGPFRVSLRGDDTAVGICGLFKRDCFEHADIGFSILPAHCRRGYAYEASAAVIDYARRALAMDEIAAIVSPDNTASVMLIEKLGLQFERMVLMPGETESIRFYRMVL